MSNQWCIDKLPGKGATIRTIYDYQVGKCTFPTGKSYSIYNYNYNGGFYYAATSGSKTSYYDCTCVPGKLYTCAPCNGAAQTAGISVLLLIVLCLQFLFSTKG